MHEGKTASVDPQSVLEVLPVTQRVHSFVGANLLQDVTGSLPRDLMKVQELWSEPVAEDVLEVVAHLVQQVNWQA